MNENSNAIGETTLPRPYNIDINRVDQEPVARDFPSRWYMRVDTGK